MPASYMTFSDVYVFRLGGSYGILLPSASSGFIFQGQPPAVLPATAFGQGLAFRFILTPQVWAITGDVSTGFDNRSGDPFSTGPEPGLEVGYSRSAGPNIVRFTITRPAVAGTGLDYTRLATVSAPVQGANRQYQCVLGIPTLAQDLTASVSGRFQRNVVTATAYVRDGSTARAYSLGRSAVAISADMAARQVTISLRLVGTPTGTAGPDVDLGAFAATAPIDQTTGNFVASLTSSDRSVTGSISGQFFGPQAVEIGAAFGASVSDTAVRPPSPSPAPCMGLVSRPCLARPGRRRRSLRVRHVR